MATRISTSREFVLGIFDEESKLLAAARRFRDEKLKIHDIFTPYAVHGLDDAMGLRHSRLPMVTFLAGATAMTLSLIFQFWASAVDWNINVGGKPENSLLAFLPITFELTVLFGGLATAASFFVRSRLWPGAKPFLPEISADRTITDHRFVIALEREDASFDDQKVKKFFQEAGAVEILERSVVP